MNGTSTMSVDEEDTVSEMQLEIPPTFQDFSTDCAICLEPLVGNSEDVRAQQLHDGHDDNASGRVITLTCGHKWHYDCIVQQLQTAQPTSKQRLLFTGCQCAKCGSICDHPDLRDLTRTTDVLRGKVDKLLEEQLALDAPDVWSKARENLHSRKATLDHARRKYAFYLCGHCREPYFGGTVECADEVANGVGDGQDQSEQRLCVACAPQSQITCRNPLEHRGHLTWKCRYCCRPSTHLCYGNVHFCDDCHERNSQRVRQSQQQQRQGRTRDRVKPPSLSPIPCPGADCPYPKPENSSTHINGPTSRSEQVYGCAWCQSTTDQGDVANLFIEPGSLNLLRNPNGELGLQGWHQLNREMAWAVEESELPVNATTNTNFVSSYLPCSMEQVLDLSTVFMTIPDHPMTLEVSARYMGRTDCPSEFRLQAALLDGSRRRIVCQHASPVLQAPPDYWERARFKISLSAAARYLVVVVVGKDSRFWQGRFGSKVTNISVRLLGSPEQLQPFLQSAFLPSPTHESNDATRDVAQVGALAMVGSPRQLPQRQLAPALALFREGLLPIICFLILAWLLQY